MRRLCLLWFLRPHHGYGSVVQEDVRQQQPPKLQCEEGELQAWVWGVLGTVITNQVLLMFV
jgi:hypothetical protein